MKQLPLFQPSSWSVSELTRKIREILESSDPVQDIWVTGEISNFTRHSSGHLYFTLKDRSSALKCVMWRNAAQRLRFFPREGDAVEVHGGIGVYEAGGAYQFYADTLQATGEGQLYQEFQRLKARLEAEGLFDLSLKRPLPEWPHVIGIVTSPTGAALHDMLTCLQRRYAIASVVFTPTAVQGAEAPAQIVQSLDLLNCCASPDVILLARGGGSIEDLWAFNDEQVARAIRKSQAPVVCGVGHETDFTIADFAADLRAPTPTAAAELATPDCEELAASLGELVDRMQVSMRGCLATPRWKLREAQNQLQLYSPQSRMRSDRQRLDELSRRMEAGIAHSLQVCKIRLASAEEHLVALSPVMVLSRGYAIVQKVDGSIIKNTHQAAPGSRINIRVSDGTFGARVTTGEENQDGSQ